MRGADLSMKIDTDEILDKYSTKCKNSEFEKKINELDEEYADKNCSFADVEQIARTTLKALPKINFGKLRDEMDRMNVQVFENPTTFQLTEAMAQVQGYKNRLAEISTLVEHEYITRKRVNDILFDANQAISKQSSADKRKGEATLRYPTLLLQFSIIESFRIEVNNIINNMRSIGDTISRQATIMQMQITLGEYRKKAPDELKNHGEGEDGVDYKSGAPELDWANV